MNKKNENKDKNGKVIDQNAPFGRPEALVFPGRSHVGINRPDIGLPAFNPPVPNRAWTAMRAGMDIDELSPSDIEEMRFD